MHDEGAEEDAVVAEEGVGDEVGDRDGSALVVGEVGVCDDEGVEGVEGLEDCGGRKRVGDWDCGSYVDGGWHCGWKGACWRLDMGPRGLLLITAGVAGRSRSWEEM